MSRRLLMTVGLVMPRAVGMYERPEQRDRASHLIVVDQETGKAIMLNLEAKSAYEWRPLPEVPLHLLDETASDIVDDRSGVVRSARHARPLGLHGSSAWERGEDEPRERFETQRERYAEAEAEDARTLDSDLAEDRG